MPARFLLVALAATLLPTSASAVQRLELKKDEPGAAGIEVSGEYRVQGSFLTDFAVDAEGTQIRPPGVGSRSNTSTCRSGSSGSAPNGTSPRGSSSATCGTSLAPLTPETATRTAPSHPPVSFRVGPP